MPGRAGVSTDPNPSLRLASPLFSTVSHSLCPWSSWGRRRAAGTGSIPSDTETAVGVHRPPHVSAVHPCPDLTTRLKATVVGLRWQAMRRWEEAPYCLPLPLQPEHETHAACPATLPATGQLWREQALTCQLGRGSYQPCPPSWAASGHLGDFS